MYALKWIVPRLPILVESDVVPAMGLVDVNIAL